MQNPEFKPGDLVRLKSGGPEMTVNSSNHNMTGQVECVCFADTGGGQQFGAGYFHPAALDPISVDRRPKSQL